MQTGFEMACGGESMIMPGLMSRAVSDPLHTSSIPGPESINMSSSWSFDDRSSWSGFAAHVAIKKHTKQRRGSTAAAATPLGGESELYHNQSASSTAQCQSRLLMLLSKLVHLTRDGLIDPELKGRIKSVLLQPSVGPEEFEQVGIPFPTNQFPTKINALRPHGVPILFCSNTQH